ncbi:hypothetical protein [Comamonas terrigena]|uniref:hypothetical protein n=1 Tax=Comamonas terrigena TaxID=32013 RepID=UPI00244CB310|nr:hypothetical protein [Comamonas terrigena]MDH0049572.1 hypothetical protein [Comamonas terrigena]MDH0512151.1 hypothetical protein [Comamonas terrigena]MDH1091678.1 hypothetical protein [Comamonas terrigena]
MFLTNDANKHPLSNACGKGSHLWISTEIQLRRPIFMVEFEQHDVDEKDRVFSIGRTVLLARGDDVWKLVSDLHSQYSLTSVALLTPASGSDSGVWSIDQLTEIWEAKDPADCDLKYKIFSRADGSLYVDSMIGTAASQLQDWRQLSVLPTASCSQ